MVTKALLLMTLSTLFAATAAFAADTQPTTPTPISTQRPDDTKFRCKFAGTFGADKDKNAGWTLACRTDGEFDSRRPRDFKWEDGDRDDKLRVNCDDRKVYWGKIMYGVLPNFDGNPHTKDAVFTGNTTISPRMVVSDFQFDRDRDQTRYASLTVYHQGTSFTIPGVCKFEKEEN